MAACAYFLERTTQIFDGAGLVLNRDEAEEASQCLTNHLVTYGWLASYYFERRVMRFKIRPKGHYLFHVAREIKEYQLNQSMFATWMEESYLGKIKAVAVKCHGRTCTQRIFQRLFLCFAIFLHEHAKVDRVESMD